MSRNRSTLQNSTNINHSHGQQLSHKTLYFGTSIPTERFRTDVCDSNPEMKRPARPQQAPPSGDTGVGRLELRRPLSRNRSEAGSGGERNTLSSVGCCRWAGRDASSTWAGRDASNPQGNETYFVRRREGSSAGSAVVPRDGHRSGSVRVWLGRRVEGKLGDGAEVGEVDQRYRCEQHERPPDKATRTDEPDTKHSVHREST